MFGDTAAVTERMVSAHNIAFTVTSLEQFFSEHAINQEFKRLVCLIRKPDHLGFFLLIVPFIGEYFTLP